MSANRTLCSRLENFDLKPQLVIQISLAVDVLIATGLFPPQVEKVVHACKPQEASDDDCRSAACQLVGRLSFGKPP